MKKIFTLFFICITALQVYAYRDEPSLQLRPSDMIIPEGSPSLDLTLYDASAYYSDGRLRGSLSGYRVRQSTAVVTLFTNPYLTEPYRNGYAVYVRFRVSYKDMAGTEYTTDAENLNIQYDPNPGTKYQAKDSYMLPENAHYAVLMIDSISITGSDGEVLSPTSLEDLFYLRFQLQIDRAFIPQPTAAPVVKPIAHSQDYGYLKFSWKRLKWAEYYDVEWLYVDDYDPETGLQLSRTNIPYTFKRNSSRIRTRGTSYEIPMTFERGYVLFRVRGVGLWGSHLDQEVNGAWSLSDSQTSVPTSSSVMQITEALQHDRNKNWQYKATYTENGKRVDAIQYLDGTLRNRQVLTNISSTDHVLVGEPLYDHQGRPAVQILPSPYQLPAGSASGSATYYSERPGLFYYPKYNTGRLGGSIVPYRRDLFDKDLSAGCDLDVKPLDNSSGSGNYFSSANPDQEGQQAYVADAEGYPLAQVEYTPDITGRIRRQGQVGTAFQLGSGHETKFYYSVPAQQELDRVFGIEAGIASHYKKQMTLDGNGQARISYLDTRGNIVATALAGESPSSLVPIDHPAPQTIVINLLEEENRRETGTASVVSSRSISISAPTTVEFDYQLVPGSFDVTTCPAVGTICYDCVYDLTIQVYDDCGAILYDVTNPIGTLDNMRNCSPENFSATSSLMLAPGSYTVFKRLSVNREAVDSYVQDYLTLTCFSDLEEDFKEKEEAKVDPDDCATHCNECQKQEFEVSYTMQHPDGTTSVQTVPVWARQEYEGDCVNTCGLKAGGCEAYFESMLADMSPGGQYALYRDTTDTENPLGDIRPNVFPVSILNESNQLPARSVSWRTPLFDYRDANGEISLIAINEAGFPEHIETEIIMRNGHAYVKPQYLNRVEDFISYWRSSWAESLVAYHPEYQYYIWCREQKESHQYDSVMRNMKTYGEAAAYDLVDHMRLGLENDPFFRNHRSAIPMMMDSLTHFFVLDTLSRPEFSLDETTYLIINCNNVNYDDRDIEACARGASLYTTSGREDKEWKLYKELYLSMKRKVMDEVRHQEITGAGGFNNTLIGWSHSTVRPPVGLGSLRDFINFGEKTKRFIESRDAFTYMPTNPESTDPSYASSWRSFLDYGRNNQYERCGTCPIASDFLSLLAGLAQEKRLTDVVKFPEAPPLTLTRRLVDAFAVSDALEYTWEPAVDGNRLKVNITSYGKPVCYIEMIQEGENIDWNELVYFINISEAGSSNKFRIRAVTRDRKEIYITGYSSCINITECKLAQVCQTTAVLPDLKIFLDYLLTNKRYQQTLHLATAGEVNPYFGHNLQALHPDFQTWDWEYSARVGNFYVGQIVITKPGDGILSNAPVIVKCPFTFEVQNGYTMESVERIISIKSGEPGKKGECEVNTFILTAITGNGQTFTIKGSSDCYVISNCCKVASSSLPCELPFTPLVPFHDTCLNDRLEVARENAKRKYDDTLREESNRLRAAYIDHCLRAAEQFMITYDESIYQYTLYYFDQANNLVKTVPPKGVHLLNATELAQVSAARRTASTSDDPVPPAHTLVSSFRYNSLNNVIEKTTPDAGTIRYCYDELGRIILLQSAVQQEEGTCSYLEYDVLGRIIETGKINSRLSVIPSAMTYSNFRTTWLTGTQSEVFKTYYDQPLRSDLFGGQPLNLRNRVSCIIYKENEGVVYDHATHYRYDISGNLAEIVQENALLARQIPAIADAGHHIKKIAYEYDLISANVNKIVYQPGEPDQFIHTYEYDADNRIVSVRTSTSKNEDALVKDIDAAFSYYKHGPLSRITLGMEKVQGLDYAYTLQGWLKGINAATLSPDRDMGRDATTIGSGYSGSVAQDAVGYGISYFDQDYKAIAAAALGADIFVPSASGTSLQANSLYNGNIRYVEIGNDAFINNKIQAQAYRYDQLNRLTDMQIFRNEGVALSNAWSGGSLVDNYRSSFRYDANGNISHVNRRDARGDVLDDLTYVYNNGNTNNQLSSIQDAVSTAYDLDLENQSGTNYEYDVSGRLLADHAEGIDAITWNNSEKVKEVTKGGTTTRYHYDSQGRRVIKDTGEKVSYDVLDNAGNLMASYEIKNDSIKLEYAPIYAGSRVGIYQPDLLLDNTDSSNSHYSYSRGLKHFELKGHTGNVLATVTDRKVPSSVAGVNVFYSDISSAHDYYPFGMEMPERSLDTTRYAFGFQGMKRDDDVKGNGNSYTTEFRQYDPRVGRWLSVDPAESYEMSPYNAFSNNPVFYTDIKGDTIDIQLEDVLITARDEADVRRVIMSPQDRYGRHFTPGHIVTVEVYRSEDPTELYDTQTAVIGESGDAVLDLHLPENARINILIESPSQDVGVRGNIVYLERPGEFEYLSIVPRLQIFTSGEVTTSGETTTESSTGGSVSGSTGSSTETSVPSSAIGGGGVDILGSGGSITLIPNTTTTGSTVSSGYSRDYGGRSSRTRGRSVTVPRIVGASLQVGSGDIGTHRRYDGFLRIDDPVLGPVILSPRLGIFVHDDSSD